MSLMFTPEDVIYPFTPKPARLNAGEQAFYRQKINRLLRERHAVMVAHYYTDPEIQALAEATGGGVGDSLEMARFGSRQPRCWSPGCVLWERVPKYSALKKTS